jgi:AcrR family transcriptional regulator
LRVRTEARRRAILEAARSVFQEQGFERASMAEISKRLGGSKATLYGYFKSKEELFVASVELDIAGEVETIAEKVRSFPEIYDALIYLGRAFLERVTSDRPIAISRMIAGLPADTRIGLTFYERGLRQAWMRIAVFFGEQMVAGKLRRANGWVMAMHFKGLLEGEFVERRMLNALPHELDQQTIERVANDAVDTFLRAYGPQSVAYEVECRPKAVNG